MQTYQQSSSTVQANKCQGFLHPPKMVLETDSVALACRKERAETLPSQGLQAVHAAEADSNCFQQPFNNSKYQQTQYSQQPQEQQQLDQKMIPQQQIQFNNQLFVQTNPNFQSAQSPQSLVTRASESLEKILNQQRIYLEKQSQPRNNENHERAMLGIQYQQQQQQYPQRSFEQQQQQFKSGSARPPQLGQYTEQNMDSGHNKNDRSQDLNISSKQHNYESRQNQQQVQRSENDQSQKYQKQQPQSQQQQQPMQYLSQVEQNYQQYQEERIRQKEQQLNEESYNIEENDNASNCESENQQVESFKIEIEKRFAKSEVNKIYEFPLDSFNSSVNESDSSLVSLCDARNYDLNIQNVASNRLQSSQNQQGQFKKKQQQQQQQLQHPKLEDYEHEKISQPIQVCLSERPINQQDQSYQQKQPIPLHTKNIQNFSKNQPTNIKDNCEITNNTDSPMDKRSNNHVSGKTLQRTLQTKSIQNLHGLSHSPSQTTKLLSTIAETEQTENLMKSNNHVMMNHNLNKSCNANRLDSSQQTKIKNQPYLLQQQQQQQQYPSQILPKDTEMLYGDNSSISQGEGHANKRLKQQLDTILKNNFIEPTDSPSHQQQMQAKQQHDLNWKLLQEKSESCYRNVNNLIGKIQSEREKKQLQLQHQEDVEVEEVRGQGISEIGEQIRKEVNSLEKEKKIATSDKLQTQNPQQFQQPSSSSTSSVLQKMRSIISPDVKSAQIVHSPNTQSSKSQFQQLQATKKERYETSRSFEVRKHANQHNNNNASNESNSNNTNSKSNQNISRNYLPSPSYSQTYLSKQLQAQQVQQVASSKSNIRPSINQPKMLNIERTSSSKAFQDRSNIITSSKSQSRERTSGNQSTSSNNRTNPLSAAGAAAASEKSSIISNDLKRNHSNINNNNNNESHPSSRSASQKAAGMVEPQSKQQMIPSTAQSSLSSRLIKNQNSQSHKNITSSQIVHSKHQSSNNKHATLVKNAIIIPETDSFVSEKLPQQATADPARFVLPEHTQPAMFSPLPPSGKAEQSHSPSSNSLEGNSILTKNMLALSQRVQAAIQGQLSSSSVSKEGNGLAESNKPKNSSSKKTSSANLMKTQSNSNLIMNIASTSSRVHASNSGGDGNNHSFNNTSKTNIRDIRLKLSSDAMSSPNNQTNSTNSFSQFKETPVIGDIKSNQSRRTDSSHGKTTAQYQHIQPDFSFPSNNNNSTNNGNAISSPNQKNNNNNQCLSQSKGNGQLNSQDHAVKPAASQSTKALNSSSRERDNCGSSGRMQATSALVGYASASENNNNPSKTNHVNALLQQPQQHDQQMPNQQIKMKNNNMIILKNLLQQHQQQPGNSQPGGIKNNNNNTSEQLKKSQQQLNLDHSRFQNAPATQSQIRTSQSNYVNKTLIKVPSASTVGNALKRASPNKSTNQLNGAAATHTNLHQLGNENSLNSRNNNNSHSRTQHSQSPPHNFPNSTQANRNQTIITTNKYNNNNANTSSNMHHAEQKHHEQQQQQPSQRSSQHASQPSTSASSKASLLHSIMQKTAKANKQIIGQQNYIDSQQNDQTNTSSLAIYKKSLEATLVSQVSQQPDAQTQQFKYQQQLLQQHNHHPPHHHNLPRNNNGSGNGSSAVLNTQPSPTRTAGISNTLNAAKKPQSNAPIAYLLGPASNPNANGRNSGNSKNLNNSCSTNQRTNGLSSSKFINSNISMSRNAQQNLSSTQNIDQSSSSILHSFIDQPIAAASDARLLSHLIPAANNISGIPRNDIQRGIPKNFSQKSFGGGGEKASSNSMNAYPQVQQLLQSMDFVSRKGNNEGSSSSSGILGQTSSFSSRYQPAVQHNLAQDKLEQTNEAQNRLKPQHMFEQQIPQYRARTLQDS